MDQDQVLNDYSRVPLISLADSEPAWKDDIVPWIPRISDVQSSGNQNKNKRYEELILSDNFGDLETLSRLDKLKINVIRERVTAKLSYGDLKLLGCSSLGFVTGNFIFSFYYLQKNNFILKKKKSIDVKLCQDDFR